MRCLYIYQFNVGMRNNNFHDRNNDKSDNKENYCNYDIFTLSVESLFLLLPNWNWNHGSIFFLVNILVLDFFLLVKMNKWIDSAYTWNFLQFSFTNLYTFVYFLFSNFNYPCCFQKFIYIFGLCLRMEAARSVDFCRQNNEEIPSSIYHCHMPFPQHFVVDFADEDLHIIRLSFFFCFSLSSSPAPPLPLLQFDLFKPLNYLSMEPLETSVCRLVVPFCACLPRPLAPGRIASAGGGACGERRGRAGVQGVGGEQRGDRTERAKEREWGPGRPREAGSLVL